VTDVADLGLDLDLGLVAARPLVEGSIDVVFPLSPGDRPLVESGESVAVGTPIAERARDARLLDLEVPETPGTRPGAHVAAGELLFDWRGRWRVAAAELMEPIETPVGGIVREVRPGTSIVVQTAGRAMRGVVAIGGPTRGRLQIVAGSDGELRSGGLDVGLAGTILVVGSRIDAETLTRARAMGVRGIIVGGLASKERRDFLASETRQRAALHRLPPYAVLVLDGASRRPLGSAIATVLEGLVGRDVAIVANPPMLLFDVPDLAIPAPPPDLVRIRGGELAGREGRWLGPAGWRRFPGGVHLEAGSVRLADGTAVAVPLGDLERFI
jgi:hypothetical protein